MQITATAVRYYMMDKTPPCFTINACNRCRRRKAKCDPGIPSCAPCSRFESVCEYTDPRTKSTMPRTAIIALEDELNELKVLLEKAQSDKQAGKAAHTGQETEIRDDDKLGKVVNADMIRLEPGEDAHFLGVSSGMHLARSVLESAQHTDANFQSSSGVPSSQRKSASPPKTRNHSPPISQKQQQQQLQNDRSAVLPAHETAMHLIDIFLGQYEVQYPIVVGDEMLAIIQECYGPRTARDGIHIDDTDKDVWNQFILKMVFAISLIILSRANPESLALSKTFSSAAMADFSTIMRRKGVLTLQCLQFLLLWSILDSSSAPIWYISGLCMRMCVDLGFHSETTICVARSGTASDAEADTKRRLFWVTYTFDRTLGTLLGRPFTLSDNTIDVHLPDQSLPAAKREQILHWFRLQKLQSQIVYRLYSLRSDAAKTLDDHTIEDTTRWKADMAIQLRRWGSTAATLADPGSGSALGGNGSSDHTLDWWEYWHQNAILLLHRPSPLKPQLDADEAETCYIAAQHMIQLSFTRLQRGSADFAWVDLHYQLMSGITLLFLVWKHAPTRSKAKTGWTSFKNCLMQWTYVLDQLALQWERIRRARDVLARLVDNTIDIIEKELCNRLSARDARVLRQAHASRASRNKTTIRQLGSPRTATLDDGAAEGVSEHQENQQNQQNQQGQTKPVWHPPQEYPQPPHTHHHHQVQHVYHNVSSPQNIQDRRPSYGTPTSDMAINTLRTRGGNNGNMYSMQTSPSHSNGQSISLQWISAADSHGTPSDGYLGHHNSLSIPFADKYENNYENYENNDNNNGGTSTSAGSTSTQDHAAFFLDQQAWHGLELYETFSAIPENITMLDYFSTASGSHDTGTGLQQSLGQGGAASSAGNADGVAQGDVAGWPDSLTNSILNFQTEFPGLGFGPT
ncbi:fungal specific transcription factor domain-containing protein [Ophiostoma piceae UAMH 11346]|uniref:Fungal specific transcription factor domain-containing protein n=1 Tax=Ophiostoma piceae (strain UAMH 11346) TaxID=1262450 RepID=S3BML9_OPHP1|nr:fungal specific transcription factor domain-containing protein [Ophiostoma piceae UAMH 11346]